MPHRNMLALANYLNGTNIAAGSELGKVLLKLPTYEMLVNHREFLNEERSADFDWQESVKIISEIGERFKEYCKKQINKTHPEIYAAKRDAAWLRFITQEYAERTAAGLVTDQTAISLEEWTKISQEVLGDTGTNISVPNILGKRLPAKDGKEQFGALAGGLGDKITKREFDVVLALLAQEQTEEGRAKLESILIGADNASYNSERGWRFLNRDLPKDAAIIAAQTATREMLEELGEWLLAKFRYDKGQQSLVEIMQEALGAMDLSEGAILILQEMQEVIESCKTPERYKEKYKTSIEPLFAKFLKITESGFVLMAEVHSLMTKTGCIVSDLSFPEARLRAIRDGSARIEDANRPNILIPKSTSYVVVPDKESILHQFFAYIADLSSARLEIGSLCVECKGFKTHRSALVHALTITKLLSEGKITYPHEAFGQIQAALARVMEEEDPLDIIDAFSTLKDLKFEDDIERQLAKLVLAKVQDLSNPQVVLTTKQQVAEAIFGKDLALHLLPKIASADAPPLTIAIDYGQETLLEKLHRLVGEYNSQDRLEVFLDDLMTSDDSSAIIGQKNADGKNAYMIAIEVGDIEKLGTLLRCGSNENFNFSDLKATKELYEMVSGDNKDGLLLVLLQYGLVVDESIRSKIKPEILAKANDYDQADFDSLGRSKDLAWKIILRLQSPSSRILGIPDNSEKSQDPKEIEARYFEMSKTLIGDGELITISRKILARAFVRQFFAAVDLNNEENPYKVQMNESLYNKLMADLDGVKGRDQEFKQRLEKTYGSVANPVAQQLGVAARSSQESISI